MTIARALVAGALVAACGEQGVAMGEPRAPEAPTSSASAVENVKPEVKPEVKPGPIASSAPSAADAGASAACASPCAGSSTNDLLQELMRRSAATRRCYNAALSKDPKLTGDVKLTVRVGSDGSVCGANADSAPAGMQDVAACAAGLFRSGAPMPAPSGGCLDATIPLRFVPTP